MLLICFLNLKGGLRTHAITIPDRNPWKDRMKRSLLSFDYITNGSQIAFTHGFPIWLLLWFFGDAIIEQCNYRNLSYLRRWTGLYYSGHLSTKPHGFVIDMSWTSKVLKGLFGKKVYSFQKCFTYQLSPLEQMHIIGLSNFGGSVASIEGKRKENRHSFIKLFFVAKEN